MAEILPWVNLLLVPVLGVLLRIESRLARLEERTEGHGRRLEALEAQRA